MSVRPGARPAQQPSALIGHYAGPEVHVMSLNLRRGSQDMPADDVDSWSGRLPAVAALLQAEAPMILGVQEAQFYQMTDVTTSLPARFRMIGTGRSGGSRGEYTAIFFDAERLELLEWDQFWLSDTPGTADSASWGNSVTRIVTWGRMFDRLTRQQLVAINTHLDHESETSRIRSAQAIRALASSFDPAVSLILTGDFNCAAAASEPFDVLVTDGPFVDSWSQAEKQLTPAFGTFNRYEPPLPGAQRIDWILVSPNLSVRAAAINPSTFRGRYPSDHLPVQALLTLPERPAEPLTL